MSSFIKFRLEFVFFRLATGPLLVLIELAWFLIYRDVQDVYFVVDLMVEVFFLSLKVLFIVLKIVSFALLNLLLESHILFRKFFDDF